MRAGLPATWQSTPTANEAKLFTAADCPLMIDDLVFAGSPQEVRRIQAEASPNFHCPGQRPRPGARQARRLPVAGEAAHEGHSVGRYCPSEFGGV